MNKFYTFINLGLILAFSTSVMYGQTFDRQECDACSSVYTESSNTAHWSVYVPIAAVVGAAVLFGVADISTKSSDSDSAEKCLGSMDNSKRHLSSYSSSEHKGYHRAKALAKTGYSH